MYNVAEFLQECLDSVIQQTYPNIEIICVNDGSTDNSLDILKRYSQKFNHLQIINQANAGLSAARNTGIRHAKGDYVFFLDSDDFLYDCNVIETMVNEAAKDNLDIVFGSFQYYYGENSNINKVFKVNHNMVNKIMKGIQLLEKGIRTNTVNSVVWNKLYRYDLIKNEFFLDGLLYEDMEYTIRIFLKARRVKMLDILTVNYRQRENSIMSSKVNFKKAIDYVNIAKKILEIKQENKFISTWVAICIYKALKNSRELEEKEKSQVLNEINSITNLPKIFFESTSIKHKLFGIYIKIFGLN